MSCGKSWAADTEEEEARERDEKLDKIIASWPVDAVMRLKYLAVREYVIKQAKTAAYLTEQDILRKAGIR